MKLFIDCGAWRGSSVRDFREWRKDADKFEIHCFEPDPRFFLPLKELRNVHIHSNAVWVDDAELLFYPTRNLNGLGGSLLKEKKTGRLDKKHPIKVPGIDFCAWLERMMPWVEYVVLKMNIEGAEYIVLERMIATGTIKYINELYGEFHWDKVGVEKSRHDFLVKKLASNGLRMLDPEEHRFQDHKQSQTHT
jgi:FkbM family methyltransferase